MRDRYIRVLSAFVLFCVLSGCDAEPAAVYQLKVTSYAWNGGNSSYVPEENVDLFDVAPRGTYAVPGFAEDMMELSVKRVSDDGIVFVTSEALSILTEDGYSLDEYDTKFELKPGETLTLVSPTCDEGMIYEFDLMAHAE